MISSQIGNLINRDFPIKWLNSVLFVTQVG